MQQLKRLSIVLCMLLVAQHAYPQSSFWTEMNGGLSGGTVNALARSATGVLFAGTPSGVYRSQTNGDSWTAANNGIVLQYSSIDDGILSLEISPDNVIFAGGYDVLNRSTDEGLTWSQVLSIGRGDGPFGPHPVAFSPSGAYFACGGGTIYRSTTRGQTWTKVFSTPIDSTGYAVFTSVTLDASGVVYAGMGRHAYGYGGKNGIYISRDNGNTWQRMGDGPAPGESLSFLKVAARGQLYAGSYQFYKSIDSGRTWTPVPLDYTSIYRQVNDMVVDSSGVMFVGSRSGVFRSTDGTAWLAMNNGLSSAAVNSIIAHGSTAMFVGTAGSGVLRWSDLLGRWEPRNTSLGKLAVYSLVRLNDGGVLAATNGGLFHSTADGSAWSPVAPTGIDASSFPIYTLRCAPDGYVYCVTNDGNVFGSGDGGTNWVPTSSSLYFSTPHLAVDINGDLLAQSGDRVYRSSDHGKTWEKLGALVPSGSYWRCIGVNWSGTILVGGDSLYVLRSTDRGRTWTRCDSGLVPNQQFSWHYVDGFASTPSGVIFLQSYDGAFRSTDDGVSWTKAEVPTIWSGGSLIATTLNGDVFSTFANYVYRSTDVGTTWTLAGPTPSNSARGFAMDANGSVFLGTLGGAYRSAAPIISSPAIAVTVPAKLQSWGAGSYQIVRWESALLSGNVAISLSTDGGLTWPIQLASDTPNDGSEWILVPQVLSSECRVRVASLASPGTAGVNAGNFRIVKAVVSILEPDSNSTWGVGFTKYIRWTTEAMEGKVTIRLSTDDGQTFPIILAAAVPNTGVDTITVPDATSKLCRIKVESALAPGVFGMSAHPFEISALTITVSEPEGGAFWLAGSRQRVKWWAAWHDAPVHVMLVSTTPSFTIPLAVSTANDGSDSVTVPYNLSVHCKIMVQAIATTYKISAKSSGEIEVGTQIPVFPGDANCDSLVDARDILPIGMYFGSTGQPRNVTTTAWALQKLTQPWAPDSMAAFADCDGNGTIEAKDVLAIVQNWGRTRSSVGTTMVNLQTVCEVLLATLDHSGSALQGSQALRDEILRFMKDGLGVSLEFALNQNWPNPFNGTTTIDYTIPTDLPMVRLEVFNPLGQSVWSADLTEVRAGHHTLIWSGQNFAGSHVASGLYLYRLTAGTFVETKRMALIR